MEEMRDGPDNVGCAWGDHKQHGGEMIDEGDMKGVRRWRR